MGKIATALRGATLSQQHRAQVVALDLEFTEMELENETLKMQKLTLEAEVNPAKREIQRLKEQIERDRVKIHSDSLDKIAEEILIRVANSEVTKERVIADLELSKAKGDHLFDLLRKRNFATVRYASAAGAFWQATAEGRQYLADQNLL